jgi:putative ABC transport system permease protein
MSSALHHDLFHGLKRARLRRSIRMGLRSLWLHRLRSLLTVLGIVFGVCSVIAMLAIGEGASYEAQQEIQSLGSHNIILRSVKPPEEAKVSNKQANFVLDYGLKYADLTRIQATIPGVTTVVPARVMREYVWNLTRRVDAEIVGTVPWYPSMRNHRVAEGRFFTDADQTAAENVAVLGAEMAHVLFPLAEPIGQTVRVGQQYYRVIGVMEPPAKSARSTDDGAKSSTQPAVDRMFIPLETAKRRYGEILAKQRSGSFEAERVALHEVTVRVEDEEQVLLVALAIKDVMERNHKKKDYDVIVPLELLARAKRTKEIFSIVLGSIAAISLVVGGIGIMNIMLATVTERTREIGIRRALGAKQSDIVTQFLIEAVMLSGLGGVFGVGLGLAIPFVVTATAGMKTIVTVGSPIAAFGISGLVGVMFGLYPALRAARMDPVEALRHE